MPAGFVIGTASGNMDVTEMWIGTTGGNKRLLEGTVGTASGNKVFGAPLAASTQVSVNWIPTSEFSPDIAFAGVTATGGVSPYTYQWTKAGGMNFSGSTTEIACGVSRSGAGPYTLVCTVTDAAGQVAVSNTCTIT